MKDECKKCVHINSDICKNCCFNYSSLFFEPPKKWKAPYCKWNAYLNSNNDSFYTRDKEEDKDRLKKDIRKLATLSARVDELGGRSDFSRGRENCYVYYEYNFEKYKIAWTRFDYSINTIYMTEECAEQIAGELNSGYLELK